MNDIPSVGDAFVGVEFPELSVDFSFELKKKKTVSTMVEAEPELWSPDRPRLYDIVIRYGRDTVRERIGFRQIRVKGHRVELNGEPLFLKGISTHGESV